MSRRQPLIALATAIALLATLVVTGTAVSPSSRSQQARMVDGAANISSSVRSRSAPARRDRASFDTYSMAAASATDTAAPPRIAIDLEGVEVATTAAARHVVRSRSRAPPRG